MPTYSIPLQPCDKCYVLRINVAFLGGGANLVIQIGNLVSGTFTSIGTIDTLVTEGNYNLDIDPTDYSCTTGFNAIRVTQTGSTAYNVNGIYLAESCSTPYCSPCFNVVEGRDCLLELSWTNKRNFADLEYEGLDYVQKAFVKGELANANYPIENNTFRFGNGDTILTYARRVKTMQLMLVELPEHMHNAISLGLMHDTFYINGEQYRLGGDYEPIWRRSSKLAPVIVEVFKKQENSRNQLC